ncbi:CheR family methyltransferase [Alicyclobacillus dauci]|uniref:protein-glutamate O-methyltransferase n=1 Tax=Alicyclobacillus dauci TaxID=1475485 RepID=A0ABY6YXY5_9BACL|nr:protein-glutamate O-methyltransferase CheR [Alicyclobacillus dauci]WAH35103.1 protein-glutamate O-methyltransferase CheR [Alicyclobacillus dauci]
MDEFEWFMDAFHQLTGIDLTQYKRPQMERRLTNLRDRRGFHDFPSYIRELGVRRELLDELLDKMTINVSEFFRNPERWEQLGQLLQNRKQPIKAWSAACSTGEEPYSLAMLLDYLGIKHDTILATDIDERVLAKAAQGNYDSMQLRGTDRSYRDKYFDVDGTKFQVKKQIRDQVEYRKHNLLSDSYPSGMDLIICRNVLIYFTDDTKQSILDKFTLSLRVGGLLFVGSTEQFFGLNLPHLKLVAPFTYEKQ